MQKENIYENWAVGSGYCRETDSEKCEAIYCQPKYNYICLYHAGRYQPVLVNDKLACNFAKAWTTASSDEPVKNCFRIYVYLIGKVKRCTVY